MDECCGVELADFVMILEGFSDVVEMLFFPWLEVVAGNVLALEG